MALGAAVARSDGSVVVVIQNVDYDTLEPIGVRRVGVVGVSVAAQRVVLEEGVLYLDDRSRRTPGGVWKPLPGASSYLL